MRLRQLVGSLDAVEGELVPDESFAAATAAAAAVAAAAAAADDDDDVGSFDVFLGAVELVFDEESGTERPPAASFPADTVEVSR